MMAEQRDKSEQPTSREARQNAGYDEAARGGKGVRPSDVGVPPNPGDSVGGDEFDREARAAANDVRRQDKSAD
jgi:hypothetical protein